MAGARAPGGTVEQQEQRQQTGGAPSISLPKGGGAIRGIDEKFAANPVSGTGSMTVPLPTSPGRAGFGPQLSLSYDSGAGNGPFGFGWTLSTPAISRKTDKGLPRYRDDEESDVFILSGSEDLVPVLRADGSRFVDANPPAGYTITRYRPRTEGLFARIERWSENATAIVHWRSISRENVTTLYGDTAQSRIADPANASHVFTWLVSQSWDDKGNAMAYEYAAENADGVDQSLASERNRVRTANRYLKRIRYGNRVSRLVQPDLSQAAWLFDVVFDYGEGHYEEVALDPQVAPDAQHRYVRAASTGVGAWPVRPDAFSSHRSCFEVRTYRRCRRVLMFHRFDELGQEPCLVRATEFEYGDLAYGPQPPGVDAELAHQGSSRFASFIRSVTQSGFVREPVPVVNRNGTAFVTYLRRAAPPVEFEYSRAVIQEDVRDVSDETLENLPAGIDGTRYQLTDLFGEGLAGVLTEQAGAWFYKRNEGGGQLGPMEQVGERPAPLSLAGGAQLLDLDGSGELRFVSLTGPLAGYFGRTKEGGWDEFRPFASLPNVRWDDPNLRFVDLDADGRADALLTENEALTWHASLGEGGFGPAVRLTQTADEEHGPRLLFADGTQSVYLADMCGDGLTDLVRIRNGEVCYWPNEGYGCFGAKVTMDGAPWFDHPDQFDQKRVRLADVDGSGTTDIIYLGRDDARIYFNQSGNRWTAARALPQLPFADSFASVLAADLLGNGTACLVWSSPLPGDANRPLRYVDLMGGRKPHLLVRSVNNRGAETVVAYTSSTSFYLADRRAGRPWMTRLPFPVHVVERIETYDRISGNLFVTRYEYHHGYFDAVEREFRGFGRVDQFDTEAYRTLRANQTFPPATNVAESSHVPPVMTRSWYHTGAYLGRDHVSDYFAGTLDAVDRGEYYREPGLTDVQAAALLLDDTTLPAGLTPEEEREACRALRGSLLRQEVYALDETAAEPHPYTVTEQSFAIRVEQRRWGNRHAVFLAHPREKLDYRYERNPADPRIAHELTLEVDDYGNVIKTASVAYGRRTADATLEARDQAKQAARLVTYTENDVTNAVDGPADWRTPLPAETRSYELTGYTPTGSAGRFVSTDFVRDAPGVITLRLDEELEYEEAPTNGMQRRLIDRVRTLYRRNDLTTALPVGEAQSLALPFESYKLAFTAGLLGAIYGPRLTGAMLGATGGSGDGYVQLAGDTGWWIPSGRAFYSPLPAATAAQELAEARGHFFLPRRYRDPFHHNAASTETVVRFDPYDLLIEETIDPLGNRVTVGERDPDPTQPLTKNGQDYRVLQPVLTMDPNRNRMAVVFDASGVVAGTAVMGKPEDNPPHGDAITAAFRATLTRAETDAFFADPIGTAANLVGTATTRIVYDPEAYWRDAGAAERRPPWVAMLARETHSSDPLPPQGNRIMISFSFSDGFSREVQKKARAEDGRVATRDPLTDRIITANGQPVLTSGSVTPRWVGTGMTVFNNKGKPIRQFEPFFSDRHDLDRDAAIGVSSLFFYDPLVRVVATLRPDHSWEKVVFGAWHQASWDANDTVLVADPTADADLAAYFERLPASEYLPTWSGARTGGGMGAPAADAAAKAAIHAATPTIAHFDPLGRAVLTVVHNKFKYSNESAAAAPHEEFIATRVRLDVEGNQREVTDALDRVVMEFDYDMLGARCHQASMDAGERWTLNDVAGNALYGWNTRGYRFRSTYDRLRRLAASLLADGNAAEVVVGRAVYGEGKANPEGKNLRQQLVEMYDQAGVVTSDEFDFKGNLLAGTRRLASNYSSVLDWSNQVALEPRVYASSTQYDALDRAIQSTTPDKSTLRATYNVAGLLSAVAGTVRGVTTTFVSAIEYDALGRRERVRYGSGAVTTYSYDRLVDRLLTLRTTRDPAAFADCPNPPAANWPGCDAQNIAYTYDPVGNITHQRDDAQQTIYFRNRRVEPSADYLYDASYRLIEATGREHLGQAGGNPNPPDAANAFHTRIDHPGDGNAMGTYRERFAYDRAGNLTSLDHRRTNPDAAGWQRSYAYAEPSLLGGGAVGNRLSATTIGGATETYSYSGAAGRHGNLTGMTQLPGMQWDFRDQLMATVRQVVGAGFIPETTWYVYDMAGQRVRKVTTSQTQAGQPALPRAERIYLGGFEIYREYGGANNVVTLERETLHIMDDATRVAMVETRVDSAAPQQLIRYQHGNHLGSCALELDAQGRVISYEEYFPYGATAYQAVRDTTEAANRFRYTGKERDEESGLYYHGARYYAPWIGRWTSCDPAELADGPNVYAYVRGNPVRLLDPQGARSWWKDALTAGAGAVYGAGKTLVMGVVGVGQATYYSTSYLLYKSTGSDVWKDQARTYERGMDGIVKTLKGGVGNAVKNYVTDKGDRFMAAIDRGDAWDAGDVFGETGMELALVADAANSVTPNITATPSALATTGSATFRVGGTIVATMPAGFEGPVMMMATTAGREAAQNGDDPGGSEQRTPDEKSSEKKGSEKKSEKPDKNSGGGGGSKSPKQTRLHSADKVPYAVSGAEADFAKVKGTSVYVLRDAQGVVLYVGEGNVFDRLRAHIGDVTKTSWFGEISTLEVRGTGLSKTEAVALEQSLIQELDPLYNIDRAPFESQFPGMDMGANVPRGQPKLSFGVQHGVR